MDIIIDIQGFSTDSGIFLPKEVAVTSLDNRILGHWIIQPPYNFYNLPSEIKIKNNWLTKYHHGIEWYEGETSLKTLQQYLRSVLKDAENIYTRGRDKATYLQLISARDIINLEENKKCPSFAKMETSGVVCHLHALHAKREIKSYTCALSNVQKLRSWLLSPCEEIVLETYDTVDNIN